MKKLLVFAALTLLCVKVRAEDPIESVYYGVEYGGGEAKTFSSYKPVTVLLSDIVEAGQIEKAAMFTINFSSGVSMSGHCALRGSDFRVVLFYGDSEGASLAFQQKMIVSGDTISFSFNQFSPFSYVALSTWPWDLGKEFFVRVR